MEKIIIQGVIATLETVEVKGSANMAALLGSINALRSLTEQEGDHGDNTDH